MNIRVRIGTFFAANARYDAVVCQVDDEEWEEMSEKERDDFLREVAQDELNNQVDAEAFAEPED